MNLHQANGLLRPISARPRTTSTRVLGIVSGKGGVGKSTLAVNLAISAAATGARSLIVDGDLGLANADLLMGLVPTCDLEDWSAGRVALDEVVCRGPAGVKVAIAGKGREVARRIRDAASGYAAEGLGALFAQQDLTVLDLGAGIGNDVLDLAEVCEPVWLVVTPEPTSLADAYATAKRLWERVPSLELELVVNRTPDRASGERTHQALSRLVQRFLSRRLPLRGMLPDDVSMARSVAKQSPLVIDEPNAPAARRLRLLAESLLEERSADRLAVQLEGD